MKWIVVIKDGGEDGLKLLLLMDFVGGLMSTGFRPAEFRCNVVNVVNGGDFDRLFTNEWQGGRVLGYCPSRLAATTKVYLI